MELNEIEGSVEDSGSAVPGVGEGRSASNLGDLSAAAGAWVTRGQAGPLTRWLDRTLDAEGVPKRLPVGNWLEALRLLANAVKGRSEGWPDQFDARIEEFFRAALRFSRPGGAPVFGPEAPPEGCKRLFRVWAERLSDPGLATVVDWWFPHPDWDRHAPPPLPADARPDRPLAVLRANWLRDGDLVAVDHREPGTTSRFELFGQGRTWLGPTWGSGESAEPAATKAIPTLWVSQSMADVAEWTFRVGKARVTRTAVLLRGRRLAVLGEHWDGAGDTGETRFALPDGIESRPVAENSRGLLLTPGRGRGSAQVLPIGLPALGYPTDRGSFVREGNELVLRQGTSGTTQGVWRAVVVSWEPKRNRQLIGWRNLTVSQDYKACPPDVAVAARITWGRDETLVVYRSLADPAIRAFLGHQTRARFLVGVFTDEGDVEPLVKVDE